LLITCLGFIGALKVDITELRCGQSPYDSCVERGCIGIVASSLNKEHLIKVLQHNRIPDAFVFGYDDHYMLMVLHSNGALAPYDPYTNTSKFVLCAGACPCPVYGKKEICEERREICEDRRGEVCEERREECKVYISNGKAEEYCRREQTPCNPPRRCEVVYDVDVDIKRTYERDYRCVEPCSESSSSSECEERERCRKVFPKKCKRACKSRYRCHRRCPAKILEFLTKLKTYKFDVHKFRRRGDVLVKVCSKDIKAKFERFIISKNGEVLDGNNKRCVPDCLPKCLKCPRELLRLKRFLEKKFCNRTVCLYINDKCGVYVLVDGRFFQVIKREGRHRRPHLRRIRGHRLRKLIHHGLYGVEFGAIDCN